MMSMLELLPLRVVVFPQQPLPLSHVLLLPTPPLQWPDLVLTRALVMAPLPVVKNKPNQIVSINDTGTCNAPLLSFEHLFTILQSSASTTSLLSKPKELQPINSDFCAPTITTSCAHRLATLIQLCFLPKSYSNSF